MALPVCLGGMGIRMGKDIDLRAFNSLPHAARELVDCIFNNIPVPESNEVSAAEREWCSGGLFLAEGREVSKQKPWNEPQAEA